jgi:hypothetical protein
MGYGYPYRLGVENVFDTIHLAVLTRMTGVTTMSASILHGMATPRTCSVSPLLLSPAQKPCGRPFRTDVFGTRRKRDEDFVTIGFEFLEETLLERVEFEKLPQITQGHVRPPVLEKIEKFRGSDESSPIKSVLNTAPENRITETF